ncbi:MAG: amidohydrolase [Pseudomonadota bacterium]
MKLFKVLGVLAAVVTGPAWAQDEAAAAQDDPRLTALKTELAEKVDGGAKLTQEIVDSLFSFSELGFQEVETQRYLTNILEANGFEVEQGVSGIPTAWWAKWGSGHPVIALGSDVDGIPKSSQKPGVAYRDPIVEGAPGHGEGHNSGQAVNITAALALKEIMERENIEGTIVLWPGVAEELVGTKAYFARDGMFGDVDVVLFTHVSDNMSVRWGDAPGTGLVSVEYTFSGEAAHGAGAPWRGQSALDAVELMNVAWNFRREHLHPLQRSHYVVVDGGDQPNVVPSTATVWYFIREITAENIRENFEKLEKTAQGAALMTDTTYERRIIGSAWPRHFSKVVAEAMDKNIQTVGLPDWDENDQALARAVQELAGADVDSDDVEDGLATELTGLEGPREEPKSGGSDDIGDVSWNVPTVTLRFPSNIDGLPGHNWVNGIAMATPIAHKGATAGAKVIGMTALDFLLKPEEVEAAWKYFREEQSKDITYEAFVGPDDEPAIEKNAEIMERYKPELEQYYYDPEQYDTYLEQLGIDYPTLKKKRK